MGFVLINNKKEADRAVFSALNMPERQHGQLPFCFYYAAESVSRFVMIDLSYCIPHPTR